MICTLSFKAADVFKLCLFVFFNLILSFETESALHLTGLAGGGGVFSLYKPNSLYKLINVKDATMSPLLV